MNGYGAKYMQNAFREYIHVHDYQNVLNFPYYFNIWEDLRPTPFNDELDPETAIDWDKYNFLIEIGDRVGRGLSMISVCFNHQGDNTLLELLDMRLAAADKDDLTAEDGILYVDLTAEKAMEIIQERVV